MGLVDAMCTTAAELRNSSGGVPRKDAEAIVHDVQGYAIQILNEAFKADPDAIGQLFGQGNRFVCNEELADHPTIQVRGYPMEGDPGVPNIGVLGLINGLLADKDVAAGSICVMIDSESGQITGFARYKISPKSIQ